MHGKNRTIIVGLAFFVGAVALVVHGQTAGGAAPADKAQWGTLWEMWKVGGPVMWPIGATSVAALGLGIYCALQYRVERMLRPDIVPALQDALSKCDIVAAQNLCSGAPSMLTNILGAALKRVNSDGTMDLNSMEKAMEEASVEEVNEGLKPLNNLSVQSQIAPMLGLLGTVTGMIGAFNKIGMGAMGSPEKLAGDIGEAMITTAAGLMVAIPAMFAYFYLKAKFSTNVARVSLILGNLLHHLGDAYRQRGIQPDAGHTL
jgi:biopolymer transport protein ExbB